MPDTRCTISFACPISSACATALSDPQIQLANSTSVARELATQLNSAPFTVLNVAMGIGIAVGDGVED